MRRARRRSAVGTLGLLLSLAWLWAGEARAGTELVLEDGQVLTGVEVRREGTEYVIELESGNRLSIPAELVRQVRIVEDEAEDPVPEGVVTDDPRRVAGDELEPGQGIREGAEQLAGDAVEPAKREDQLAELGPRSRFSQGWIDPEWQPSSDWSLDTGQNDFNPSTWADGVVDPRWKPEPAYPERDALEAGRSTWRSSLIDNEWRPTDGFEKKKMSWSRALAGVNRTAAAAESEPASLSAVVRRPVEDAGGGGTRVAIYAPRPPRPVSVSFEPAVKVQRIAPETCAGRIFAPLSGDTAAAPAVQAIADGRYIDLPIQLHEARQGDDVRAVFTVDHGECRLLGGDLQPLLGVHLTEDHAAAHATKEYNEALSRSAPVKLATERDKLRYGMAVASLADTDVSGHAQAELEMLRTRERLDELLDERADDCVLGGRKQRKEGRDAVEGFMPPGVESGADGEVVRFVTWTAERGQVARHAVYLEEDGTVAVDRELLAEHVGRHDCAGAGGAE